MTEEDPGRITLANVLAFFLICVGMWASIFIYENLMFTAIIVLACIVYLLKISPETLAKIVDIIKKLLGTKDDP